MSWWVSLNGPDGEPLQVDHFSEGGTFTLGGSSEAHVNITYNYSSLFIKAGICIREFTGLNGSHTIPLLEEALKKLDGEPDEDYWRATPGNAAIALRRLLLWARQHPEGTWRVS